jgi:hypothetical protein
MNSKKVYSYFLCIAFLAALAMPSWRAYAADQPSLTAELKIRPDCLNVKCPHGPRLTCVITFPQEFDTSGVDEDGVMLENVIRAQSVTVHHHAILARFSRDDVLPLLERKVKNLPGAANVLVSGTMEDGASFQAQGNVRVICPPTIDLAVEPCHIKSGDTVRVMAKSDQRLDNLKVFIKQPGIGTKAVAVKMDYDGGSDLPYRYAGSIDTSDLTAGKALIKVYATDSAGEPKVCVAPLGVR